MCGIAGIFNSNGAPVVQGTLKAMTDAIAHRGPDGEGLWVNEYVGFGHRRLSVLDLSDAAHQPMKSQDSAAVIIYNGEVYNFRELRSELEEEGYVFRSSGDTEVVLNAYHAWGIDCIKRFNGMFALAIWDARKKALVLARDRYGIKPLYYWYGDSTLIFASEIKGLLQSQAIERTVDHHALLEYFTFQNIFTDRTLLEGIKLLPSGHTAVLERGKEQLTINQYWDFNFCEPSEKRDEGEYVEELDRLFSKAVHHQLVSDVPVGAYLSGGMDSGAITAIAARELPYLTSFTGGFDLSSASGLEMGFDERQRAEALSYRFKTEHYEIVMKAGDMERVMPDLIWHLEDLRVGQCYPNYYVSRLASKFCTVVLAGTGSDEIFAGYPWRYYHAADNQHFENYIEKYYKYWQRLVPNRVIHRLFQPHIGDAIGDIQTIDIFRKVAGHTSEDINTPEEYINRSLYVEAKTFLHGLLIVEDKLSMSHGLETRVPFLDNDLVDFAMSLPVRTKLRDLDKVIKVDENAPGPKRKLYYEKTNDGKLILRNVLARYVPYEYVNGTKQGFSAPDASWFRGESIEYVRGLLLNKKARIYEYLRYDTVSELVDEHLSGKENRRLFIWSLLCFEWWCTIFLNGGNLNVEI